MTKIDVNWLDTHKWMLRSSDNGISCDGFRWKSQNRWTLCPDWNTRPNCGGGLHGETPKYNGLGFMHSRIDLCEYTGDVLAIGNDKVKVRKARIVASNTDIPEEAFIRCGYKVAHDGETISPSVHDRYIIMSGHVIVSNQSGGYCRFYDNSQGMVSNQSDGDCRFYDNSRGTVSNQSGGYCRFYDNSRGTVSNQSGGYCRFSHNAQGTVSNQSEGDCWFSDNAIRHMTGWSIMMVRSTDALDE